MDKRIKQNITYIIIYVAGILTGLSIIWKYPKAYSIMLLILAVGFILHLNDAIFSKNKDNDKLIIKIQR